MKNKILNFIVFLFFIASNINLLGQNIMKIHDVASQPGAVISVELVIINTNEFAGFNADIPLPEGFQYISGSATLFRGNGHSFSFNVVSGNIARAISFAIPTANFSGTSGVVLSFDVQTPEVPGNYTLDIQNAVISDADGVNILSSTDSGNIILESTPQYTLTLSIEGQGSVEVNGTPYSAPLTVEAGTLLNLEAIANPGWEFSNWTGDATGTLPLTAISMDSDKTVSATFSLTETGHNIMKINDVNAQAGEILTIELEILNEDPFAGFNLDIPLPEGFQYVDGSATLFRGNGHSLSFSVVAGNIARAISFAFPTSNFTGNSGVVLCFNLQTPETPGTFTLEVTNAVIADETGNNIMTGSDPGTILLEEIQRTITASAGLGGSIDPEGVIEIVSGNNQTFNILPDSCFEISDVLVDGISVGNVSAYTFENVQENHSIHAIFEEKTFTIVASANTGGLITPSGAVTVNCEASQAFSILPASGYMISDVLVDGSSVGALTSYTFTNVTANHTITASFALIPTYALALTVNPLGAGTVSGGGTYEEGEVVPLSATASACYTFVNWTSGSTVVSTQPAFNYTMPGSNATLTANFILKTYTLSASAGAGGSITPSRTVTVNCGASQTFTIAPSTGYMISEVLVDGSSVGAVSSYTFTNVTANHSITASFALIPTYTLALTVNPPGAGTVSGGGTYEEGEVVPLSATANACYDFLNWTHGSTVVSTQPAFNYTMPGSNVTLTANFVLKTYTITASVGTGGSISPSGAVTVNCGASQAFAIAPATGYFIDDVLVDGSSVGAVTSYTFTNVTANHTITAIFALIPTYSLALTVNPPGAGTVSGGGTYEEGEVVPLTATANSCYNFVNWTLGSTVISTQPSFSYTMPGSNVTLMANFILKTYTITASAGTGGSISPSGAVTVNCGASQTFTIAPSAGYVISNVLVDGSSVGAVSSYTFTNVTASHTISASFAEIQPNEYVLSLNVNPAGAGTVSGGGTYVEEAVVPVTATPSSCYNFVNWTNGTTVVSTQPAFNYTMPGSNVTLTANFMLKTYTITASAGTGGSISPSGNITVNCEEDQTFIIIPDDCYQVQDVLVYGVSVGDVSSYTFANISGPHSIEALFEKMTYTISASAGTGGSITPEGDVSVECGDNQNFAIIPNTGYLIDDVLVDGSSVGPEASFTFENVTASHTISASFSEIPTYLLILEIEPTGAGEVTGEGSYEEGALVNVTAMENAGYAFAHWKDGEEVVSTVANFTFLMPASDLTLKAIFLDETSISESLSEDLKIYPNPASSEFWIELINRSSRRLDIQLINLQGQVVDHKTLDEPGEIRTSFNVANLHPGVYLLSLQNDKINVVRKIVIQK